MEIWLPIANSDLLVSNLGRIKNNKGKIFRLSACKRSGYVRTDIKINGVRIQTSAHILVAKAFIPNLENKPYVNHINGIKYDNWAVNLEWVTPKENAERKVFPNPGRGNSRQIVQKTLDGNVVQVWNSIRLASESLKISENAISQCCRGIQNSAKGWYWAYYEDYVQQDSNEEWREIELNSRKIKISSLGKVQLQNGLITQGSLYAGYYRIGRVHKYRVHRLVALAFCHTVRLGLWGNCRRRAVKQIFDDGTTQEFTSLVEAQRITGIKSQGISSVCRGLRTHTGGCRWEYIT